MVTYSGMSNEEKAKIEQKLRRFTYLGFNCPICHGQQFYIINYSYRLITPKKWPEIKETDVKGLPTALFECANCAFIMEFAYPHWENKKETESGLRIDVEDYLFTKFKSKIHQIRTGGEESYEKMGYLFCEEIMPQLPKDSKSYIELRIINGQKIIDRRDIRKWLKQYLPAFYSLIPKTGKVTKFTEGFKRYLKELKEV